MVTRTKDIYHMHKPVKKIRFLVTEILSQMVWEMGEV